MPDNMRSMLKTPVGYQGAHSGLIKSLYRVRLYPRMRQIIREVAEPGGRLVWSPIDGRYRINGKWQVSSVVRTRSSAAMLRMQILRVASGTHPDLLISSKGRHMLAAHDRKMARQAREKAEARLANDGAPEL